MKRINALFAVGAAGLACVVALSAVSFQHLSRDSKLRIHSYERLDRLDSVLTALLNIETGARGFALSGASEFLKPYEQGRRAIQTELAGLRALNGDNPAQQQDVATLGGLVRQRIDRSAQVVETQRTAGQDTAQQLVASSIGRHVMDEARQVLAQMVAEEKTMLRDREATLRRTERLTLTMTVTMLGLALSLFVTAFVIYSREQRRRIAVEAALLKTNDQLEQRVRERTAELHEREQRLFTTLRSIGDAVIATGADGRIDLMNPVAETLTGWTCAEAQRKTLEEVFRIVNEETRTTVENPVHRVLREGVVVGLANHTLLIARDGVERPIADSAAPIRDDGGAVTGVVLVCRDQTAERKTLQTLREREARQCYILSAGPTVIYTLRPEDFTATWVSPNVSALLGYTEEEALEPGWWKEHLYPEDRAQALANDARVLEKGHIEHEYRFLTKDGTVRWLHDRMDLQRAPGQPDEIVGVWNDITARKRVGLYRDTGREVLRILNESSDVRACFENLVAAVKEMIGFDAVGIRLREGDDFPYYAQRGFDEGFLRTENSLVAHTPDGGLCRDKDGNVALECMCGLVISGRIDPANPLFTRGGSFWTNNALPLLDLPPDQDSRLHPRNKCMHQGYTSRALVPIRARDRIVGLIQLNSRRPDGFTPETVEILEGMASNVGVALLRFEAEARLRTFNAELEQRIEDRTQELTLAMEGAEAATAGAVEVRKQVEQAIRERELFFSVNLDMFCIAGFDGCFRDLNPSWERILGYSSDELRVKPFIEFVHPEDRQATLDAAAALSCGEDVVAFENRYRCKDGSYRWIKWNSRSVIKEGLIFAAAHDVTDSKRLELALRAARDEAEAATRAKSEFLANMSHELRTPLNAVIGFSEALEDRYFGDLAEKQAEYVRCITESGQHLLALINDILDLSKVEAGKMTLELGPVRVGDLLENSLLMVKEKCFKHRIALNLDVGPELRDLAIEADARKLKQIVFNLLSNSAKFTPDGGSITVEARRVSDQPKAPSGVEGSSVISYQLSVITDDRSPITSPHWVEISVADTGIGISREMQEKVFESFFQVNGGTKDKSPGTGLGLQLVKRLAELHGGAVAIESAGEGKGCRVTVRLPTGAGGRQAKTDEPVGPQPDEGRHGKETAKGRGTF